MTRFEDDQNSSIALRIKDGKGKWIGLFAIYRQWKIPGESNAFSKEGISRQVARLKVQVSNLERFCRFNKRNIICGDLNMDKYEENDLDRPELKALEPTWEQFVSDFNLTQINHKPTWHMPGKSPSLLDIFYADCPNQIDCVQNVTNLLSEHDAVK